MTGRTFVRYHAQMHNPPMTVNVPSMITAIQPAWLRPASTHAHWGRRAASSSAHALTASGMLNRQASPNANATSNRSMS